MKAHLGALAFAVKLHGQNALTSLERALESDMPESARQAIKAAIVQIDLMKAVASAKLTIIAEAQAGD